MDRNSTTNLIARRVSEALLASGADLPTLAEAADITTEDLNDRLNGRVEFQVDELVRVGGFLRSPITELLGGAA